MATVGKSVEFWEICVPPYRRLCGHFPFGLSKSPPACSVGLGVAFALLLFILSWFDPAFRSRWVLPVLPLLFASTLALTNAGYDAVRRSMPVVFSLLTSTEQVTEISQRLRSMFAAKAQGWVCLVTALFTAIVFVTLRFQGRLPPPFQHASFASFGVGVIFVALAGYFGGWGIWLVVSMVRFIRQFHQFDALALNPLVPQTTIGLRRLPLLAGTFALYFSVGIVLIGLPILMLPWQGEKDWLFVVLVYTPPLMFLVLTASLLVYPPLVVRRLVQVEQERVLLAIESSLRGLVRQDWGDTDRLIKLADVQKRVLEGGQWVVGFSWITRLLTTLAVQLPFVLQWLEKAGVDIRGAVPRLIEVVASWFTR